EVGKVDDRRPVFDRDPPGLDRHVEAVGSRRRRDYRNRGVAVAPEHALEKVALLGLGRDAGAGADALDVDYHERELGHHGEADRLTLEGYPGAARAGHTHVAAKGSADRRTDGRDLIFRLEGLDAEALHRCQLVEDVARRRNRVAAVEERAAGQL